MKRPDFAGLPSRHACLALLVSCALAGCAALPDLPAAATPRQDLASPRLESGTGQWVSDQWWHEYQDPQLDALIEEALAGSPDLAAARARLLAADGMLRQSGAALEPTADIDASVSHTRQSYNNGAPAAFVPHGFNNSGRLALDIGYRLDVFDRHRAALAATRSNRAAVAAELAEARLVLTTSVASSYAELAHLYRRRDTAAATLRIRERSAGIFASRQAGGLETLASLRVAQSRLETARAEVAMADEAIGHQATALAALLGKGPERASAVTRPAMDIGRLRELPTTVGANLLGRRPDIVVSRLRVEAARGRVDEAHAAFYPDINLSASVGFQSLGLSWLTRNGSETASVGPALSLPLFRQGELQGRYQVNRATYDEAVANYDKTLVRAWQDFSDVMTSRHAITPVLRHQQQSVELAEQARNVAEQRYRGGLATALDVLSAEDTLLAGQRLLDDSRARLMTLDISLIAALGGGYGANAR
ncbi:efflux transporter outer membrane subunit [Paludibacterium paludis]|uniref:NodT family efflux transporter outer membrane factor (OMF) lipoprotein n=1 Tax=Paludibacterium paludis TaxID=1225769 RepID=A0A918UB63_9NEIS|nr:efflux transporter outer membrane subunit [Paludibacterium paludis]GGY21482.1 hypothetical protein GCM10011289_26330 [Paludibacterium paludis]